MSKTIEVILNYRILKTRMHTKKEVVHKVQDITKSLVIKSTMNLTSILIKTLLVLFHHKKQLPYLMEEQEAEILRILNNHYTEVTMVNVVTSVIIAH